MLRSSFRTLALGLSLAALGACSDRADPPPEPQAAAAIPAPTPAQPTILDAQLQQIERAKAVEQDVLDSQKKVDEAMEQQEGG